MNRKSYSVLNTHKAMLLQTLPFFGNSWCGSLNLIPKFMKGIFHCNPPKSRYKFTWDVTVVLRYLKTLFPLKELSLKMLTLKLVALIALCCAPRAQTLVAMNLDCVLYADSHVTFFFPGLLKTSRSSRSNAYSLILEHFEEEPLCVMHTLLYYIKCTKHLRKSRQLLISYVSYDKVSTSTVARWLKTVLQLSGIDSSVFKAHSYRSAAVSAAVGKCSLKSILDTADWSSDRNFYKFYYRPVVANSDVPFARAVLQ